MVKLDDDNFLFWKHQVLVALKGHGLQSFLEEKVVFPPKTIPSQNSSLEMANPPFQY